MTDPRAYPDRPFVAVSAAILRDRDVLLVRRAQAPANRRFTLPGGVVEVGETLEDAVMREVSEETGLVIRPLGLAGHREFVVRDDDGRVSRHFIILAFAARYLGGEPVLNEELSEFRWVLPDAIAGLPTTDGLSEIVADAFRLAADKP
ncbi:NADH pyrophosphatase [Variibacter gotjawalensis]|uniref:NADH pyrophosphatase n=1 Tax=Variibacter gotjawalensis TaxID=1333996 RepID=A0A0S3PSX2_9BRAD|nr:NUDIX hydrolase [Variibacter gotjawalensis]NIK49333.1 ADP-ribose pyrophosphatase YjhB (NUDIX family) [Variibacter gotjawalensis]RZS51184.1 ADP-ribose pyrophosphatase YjhB (NUDIX family) [Variibacter gotjawalensis]BAT59019.1 NADH pyrophosphatase [Variibacter gotjawalensis]